MQRIVDVEGTLTTLIPNLTITLISHKSEILISLSQCMFIAGFFTQVLKFNRQQFITLPGADDIDRIEPMLAAKHPVRSQSNARGLSRGALFTAALPCVSRKQRAVADDMAILASSHLDNL